MDGDLNLLSLLPDEDLVSILLPGDRLLSLLVVIALDDLLLSDMPLGDLDLVLEALLSGVPHDLLSSLLEPLLLLGGEGDGDMVWLLLVAGNVTLGPCLPEVPA